MASILLPQVDPLVEETSNLGGLLLMYEGKVANIKHQFLDSPLSSSSSEPFSKLCWRAANFLEQYLGGGSGGVEGVIKEKVGENGLFDIMGMGLCLLEL